MSAELRGNNVGVVIPVAEGREANLEMVLGCLARQTVQPGYVCVIEDGPGVNPAYVGKARADGLEVGRFAIEKHQPGREQPRNVGVRLLRRFDHALKELNGGRLVLSHVWFLDSDVVVDHDCLEAFLEAHAEAPEERILLGPYEWLPPNLRPFTWRPASPGRLPREVYGLHNDPRSADFARYDASKVLRNDLSAGLACLSGNLMWPIEEFTRVGGFWSELHTGRCEDGELGIRAVAMDVPISFARNARGWHLFHHIDVEATIRKNQRDVPMLNGRHPWMEENGPVFMVDRDGKAFDVRCPKCGGDIPTIRWWTHAAECGISSEIPAP